MSIYLGYKKNFIELPGKHGKLFVMPGAIVSIRDLGGHDQRSEVIFVAGAEAVREEARCSAQAVIGWIEAVQEVLEPSMGTLPPADPEEELKRKEREAEALGRGLARGQIKGAADADRDSWGGRQS